MAGKIVKIGVGSGWAGDRIDAAKMLVERVDLDFLMLEAMSESTVSSARERMLADPNDKGYDPLLEERMRAVLPACHAKGIKIVSNQGWANPEAARDKVIEIARELGMTGLKVASVSSNDLGRSVIELGDVIFDTGEPLDTLPPEIIAAEPYMGAEGVVEALKRGADIVLTSRMSDNSLAIGPLAYAFGWTEIPDIAVAAAVGHMLECGITGMSGGFMADPPRLEIPGYLDGIGLPYAEVHDDGDVYFEKTPDSGGFVSRLGLRKKLMHEIGDAANYYDPNVIVDLASIEFDEVAPNRVRMHNIHGRDKPATLKVNIATREGYMTQDFCFFAGPRAFNRAKAAAAVLEHRVKERGLAIDELVIEYPGINAVFREATPADRIPDDPWEVCMRIAARAQSRAPLLALLNEFDANGPNGPFGTGKGIPPPDRIRNVVGISSTLVPREAFHFNINLEEA
ncbi:acyclic terpene utilization AtuA family protein [Sphingomonas sp.]|uniref:acyclic terpene utilization AtuA family protein n=1 Tax=Sphingomonas sp. TaxID=28214 RepID=UPI003D6CE561